MKTLKILLELNNIVKRYHKLKKSESSFVLNGVNLIVERGKVTSIIGSNGAGKTTLFNIINGFTDADSGSICYYDKTGIKKYLLKIQNNSREISLPPYKIAKLKIGRLFQDMHLFQNMSLLENVMVAAEDRFGENPFQSFFQNRIYSVEKKHAEKASDIIEKVLGETLRWQNSFSNMQSETGIKDAGSIIKKTMSIFKNYSKYGDIFKPPVLNFVSNDILRKDACDFSYGQQRLISLAMLFMGNYDLLLLDEPTAGVNQKIIDKILKMIRELVDLSGKTVVMIEHNMDAVLKISDHCFFMDEGVMKHFGTPKDFIGNPKVRREYLGI
jgi:branched-chain amino acid transport system ATP-binding protein